MKLVIYPLLNVRSKRAMTRVNKRFGWYYRYEPRQILVNRLKKQLNWTEQQVREQIEKERLFVIEYLGYF